MTRRKGELTRSGINQDWPYQVAVREIEGQGLGILRPVGPLSSLCPRDFTVGDGKHLYRVFCFADLDQAEAFRQTLGAEMCDPRDRGVGANGSRWVRGSGAGNARRPRR